MTEVNTFNVYDNFIRRLQCGISGNQNSIFIGNGRMAFWYEPCYLLNFWCHQTALADFRRKVSFGRKMLQSESSIGLKFILEINCFLWNPVKHSCEVFRWFRSKLNADLLNTSLGRLMQVLAQFFIAKEICDSEIL